MADFRIGSGPFFDRGIDDVVFKGSESAQGLPDQRQLTPAERTEGQALEQLLARPDFDSFLDDSIRPTLQDRDLLLPTQFRNALEGTLSALTDAATTAAVVEPEDGKVLNRAVRLLNEEVNLRDLLQMYRSALYQG